MGKSATRAVFALTLSTLLGLAMLALHAHDDASHALTLADLDRAHQTLMSCDMEANTAEPMWCADPSDPQCMPAAPAQPHAELSGSAQPVHAALGFTMPARPAGRDLLGWTLAEPTRAPKQTSESRLERPPRA